MDVDNNIKHLIILPYHPSKKELRERYQCQEFYSSWWEDKLYCDEQIFRKAEELGHRYGWEINYEAQYIDTFLNIMYPGWFKRLTQGIPTEYHGSAFPTEAELLSLKGRNIEKLWRGWTLLVNK